MILSFHFLCACWTIGGGWSTRRGTHAGRWIRLCNTVTVSFFPHLPVAAAPWILKVWLPLPAAKNRQTAKASRRHVDVCAASRRLKKSRTIEDSGAHKTKGKFQINTVRQVIQNATFKRHEQRRNAALLCRHVWIRCCEVKLDCWEWNAEIWISPEKSPCWVSCSNPFHKMSFTRY